MVMFTYGDFFYRKEGRKKLFLCTACYALLHGAPSGRRAVEASLCGSLLRLNKNFRLRHYFLAVRIRDLVQDVIHCLWDARIRPVELSRGLGSNLA
jgi:hypothetical protein